MENNKNNRHEESVVYRPQNAIPNRKNLSLNVNKQFLWNFLNVFISGLLGGIAFSVGGITFLSLNNKSVGSALFTIGMVVIYAYGFGFIPQKSGIRLKTAGNKILCSYPFGLVICSARLLWAV